MTLFSFSDYRQDHDERPLNREDLNKNPLLQIGRWIEEAIGYPIPSANAMTLSTYSERSGPAARTVLLKEIDESGLIFYTYAQSRKAAELSEEKRACGSFFWSALFRQLLVEGRVEKLSKSEVALYFDQRPRGSQLSACCSRQGEQIESRQKLETLYESVEKSFEGREIPCPDSWIGFRLIPERIEFWQGRMHRLHDRIEFRKKENQRKGAKEGVEEWEISRLAP